MAFRKIVLQQKQSVPADEDLEDIPEKKRHAREERKRSRDILIGAVVMNDVRRIVENRDRSKDRHRSGEYRSKVKSEED